jgi:acyl carrier protein
MSADTTTIESVVFTALEEFGADKDAITREATFEVLDVDSLDLAELAQIVEEEFGVAIKSSDVESLQTVGDVLDLIAARA